MERINTAWITFTSLMMSSALSAQQVEFIMPEMVEIPAGSYNKTSAEDIFHKRNKESISVERFQLSKYKVTVAEFKKFAETTGFDKPATCNDKMDSQGLPPATDTDSGHWSRHANSHSDYQPVICISWQDAQAYAAWLSEESGIPFRIPSEYEWEYAAKGNTQTRYHWGDDLDNNRACLYGNFADYSGEAIQSRQHGFSNIGWLDFNTCDDGESYTSIVGLYRPNPFGLYDMGGNEGEMLATCYQEGDGSDTNQSIEQCEYLSNRGGSWHAPAKSATKGWRFKRLDDSTSLSFRLATDYRGKIEHASTAVFKTQLANAQQERKAQREKLLPMPRKLQAHKTEKGNYQLTWQPVSDERITAYEIFQAKLPSAHLLGYLYTRQYDKILTVSAETSSASLPMTESGTSYKIVAVANDLRSLASEPVLVDYQAPVINIPGKVTMDKLANLDNAHLLYQPPTDDLPALYGVRKVDFRGVNVLVTGSFKVNVAEDGWYQLNYRGRSRVEGDFFRLWRGQQELFTASYSQDVDDSKSERNRVYLPEGEHTIEFEVMRETEDYWILQWLEFTALNSDETKTS